MKRALTGCALALAATLASGAVLADAVNNVYNCKLKEGKTIDELQAANSKWLAWVRENVDKGIDSGVGTAVVGNQDMFLFIDHYPDLKVWAAAQTALQNAPDEIEEGLDAVSDCTQNSLWRMRPTP